MDAVSFEARTLTFEQGLGVLLRCAFEHASTNATRRATSSATRRALFENRELRTGSAVWRLVAPVARRFMYTRGQYT